MSILDKTLELKFGNNPEMLEKIKNSLNVIEIAEDGLVVKLSVPAVNAIIEASHQYIKNPHADKAIGLVLSVAAWNLIDAGEKAAKLFNSDQENTEEKNS